MTQTILEMATDLTIACVPGLDSPKEVIPLLQRIYAEMVRLERGGFNAPVSREMTPLERLRQNPEESIGKTIVVCLECGESYKSLGGRHLPHHGLTSAQYRKKYGLSSDQPLASRESTKRRREIAQVVKPWEKSPNVVSYYERNGLPTDQVA